jgi:hypothetical protein
LTRAPSIHSTQPGLLPASGRARPSISFACRTSRRTDPRSGKGEDAGVDLQLAPSPIPLVGLHRDEVSWRPIGRLCVALRPSFHNVSFSRGVAESQKWGRQLHLRNLILRWTQRNQKLVCPHCKRPASSRTFKRGRYLLAEEELVCDQCGEASPAAFWRYHGLASPSDGSLPMAS